VGEGGDYVAHDRRFASPTTGVPSAGARARLCDSLLPLAESSDISLGADVRLTASVLLRMVGARTLRDMLASSGHVVALLNGDRAHRASPKIG
jgi:hypothetical protein